MSSERPILVAVEDMSTAGVVATGAAHFALEQDASRVILLHVLDDHVISNGFAGLIGGSPPVVETADEGSLILSLAEAALCAEYKAMNRPVPAITRQFRDGRPGATIAEVAETAQAAAIVVGARRPHAFGRLTHPDAVDYLRGHTGLPVHVVALQADESEPADVTNQ